MVSAGGSPSYQVTAVRYGTRSTTKSDVFLHYSLYGEPDEPVQMDYFFWVVRNPARTILVDCGFNDASGTRRGRTMLLPPVAALRQLGIEPGDVSLLILTHAHYDHVGNVPEFPVAEIVMSEREYEFWTGPLGTRALFATSAETADIAALSQARAAGRLRLLPAPPPGGSAARQSVAPGVDVLELGGHTPGQLVVLVSAEGGEVVIASDALHYYDELRLDRPFTHVADLPAMYQGFELLRELASDKTRYLVAGHDPEVMRRFPADDSLPAGLAVRIGPPAGGQAAASTSAAGPAGTREQ
ncbi:MAG: N-acyl homoserine lactonase family protein [Actinobacteria bacterium]|nr:N-acyl homoserine lactonase family protein [Actinomycetota bacterium]